MNKSLSATMLMYMLLAQSINGGIRESTDPLSGVNILEEYKLIQQKKSQLSRAHRELVITRYEKLKPHVEKCQTCSHYEGKTDSHCYLFEKPIVDCKRYKETTP